MSSDARAWAIRREARGTRLLQQLIAGSVPGDNALMVMDSMGIGEGPWTVQCMIPGHGHGHGHGHEGDEIELALALASVDEYHLYLRAGADHLVQAREEARIPLADAVGDDLGIIDSSEPFTSLRRTGDAVLEA